MIDSLTLDQLRVLIAVADEGSFSGAARRLGRVQSAISQAVQTLEATLELALFDRSAKKPVLTQAGRSILADARQVVARSDSLRAHAGAIAGGCEPELALSVDPLFPQPILMESLKALSQAIPHMPVKLITEGLGGPEQSLREGIVPFAIYALISTGSRDLHVEKLTDVEMIPVVAADHPLAREAEPVSQEVVEGQTQLVLMDRTPLTQNMRGNIFSSHVWRFADIGTRLDYLLAGFGWCHMPIWLVREHIEAGRLKRLHLAQSNGAQIAMHVVREHSQRLGPAGQWLIADLRKRLEEEAAASAPGINPTLTPAL
jgi:DNA-binding transcriptional LysR family regulator